ncbi:MAG: BLUF domain-containing protein [Comamonadaceae bacterium]|nr:MAG: BLUF domain-containing protein [Comamonadaceae bacterium]
MHASAESPLMLRLVYISHAVAPVDTALPLKQAWEKNPGTGITGGLAVLDEVFLQYLEGEDEQVDALFARISNDHRHRDVKVLERRAIARRMFGNWSMAVLVWTDETRNIFRSFSPDSVLDLYQTDPSTAAPLFRAWAATSAWTARR